MNTVNMRGSRPRKHGYYSELIIGITFHDYLISVFNGDRIGHDCFIVSSITINGSTSLGTKKMVPISQIASKRTNLVSQVLTEVHIPIMKDIEPQISVILSSAKRWITFPGDKSVVCMIIMRN